MIHRIPKLKPPHNTLLGPCCAKTDFDGLRAWINEHRFTSWRDVDRWAFNSTHSPAPWNVRAMLITREVHTVDFRAPGSMVGNLCMAPNAAFYYGPRGNVLTIDSHPDKIVLESIRRWAEHNHLDCAETPSFFNPQGGYVRFVLKLKEMY